MPIHNFNRGGHVRITSKRQVTIRRDMRERRGFLLGTVVEFVDAWRTVRQRKVDGAQCRSSHLVEHVRGSRFTIQPYNGSFPEVSPHACRHPR